VRSSKGEILSLTFHGTVHPDLMPADITGTNVLTDDPSGRGVGGLARVRCFPNVLADEINRARKTQSALLEAMQELQKTSQIGGKCISWNFHGAGHTIPSRWRNLCPKRGGPVFSNPVAIPSRAELGRIADRPRRRLVGCAKCLMARRSDITNECDCRWQRWFELCGAAGADDHGQRANRRWVGPALYFSTVPIRAACKAPFSRPKRALFAGRPNVSFDDIRVMLLPSLRHRLILNLEADAAGIGGEKILQEVIEQTKEVE
jgi:MoxR-like ATPase